MAKETFTQRFNDLVKGWSDKELAYTLGVTTDAARKMRQGTIQSLKLQAALRLSRELGISPWALAGEDPPPPSKRSRSKGVHATSSSPPSDEAAPISSAESAELRDALGQLQAELRETREMMRLILDAIRERQGIPEHTST